MFQGKIKRERVCAGTQIAHARERERDLREFVRACQETEKDGKRVRQSEVK